MVSNIWNRYAESAASQYGVPLEVVQSVIGAESSWRPNVEGPVTRSGQRAGGLMQLMPDTFAELRQTHGLGPDRFDPQTNIQAGTAYLGQLYKQFGNWPDAVSAYNAGPNRWRQVKAGEREAPRETVDYTKKVTAGFGGGQGADVGLFGSARGAATDEMMQPWSQRAMDGGLLEFGRDKNFYEGLGGLLNFGQTQTDRLDLSGLINERLQQYLQKPPVEMPSELQYMLGGMQKGVQGLAGVHDRKVGLGEMLGALGGGATAGMFAGNEAQQQQRANQIGELGTLAKLQDYQRTEADRTRQAQTVAALAQQLRAAGKPEEAQLLEANPSLIEKYAEQRFKTPDPYTLAPGETRFDAQGRPVAQGGPKPQTTSTPLSTDEVAALGLPPGTVAQRDSTGAVTVISKPDKPPEDKTFAQAKDLRTEYNNQSKPFIEVRDAYDRVDTAYNSGKDITDDTLRGPSDIAMVFNYMKMLDPGSVVKEGEFATLQNSGGIPETIRGMYNKLVGGGVLTQPLRDSIRTQAEAQYGSAEKGHMHLQEHYTGLATRAQVKPEDVVIDHRRKRPEAKAPDPNNWKVGDRARNPTTGETIQWNGSAWVPAP